MAIAQLKQELHGSIDTMTDKDSKMARPFISVCDEIDYVIETDLTDEERAFIEDSARRYRDDPSGFVSLAEAKRRLGCRLGESRDMNGT
ncbi:MAG: hypothetical protein LBT00_05575 [Spirochaetaceae bacterium]|jgi:transcriptional regulator CtsR|nr:hypothetical protein [Spirochaetaceae bacterium]